MTGVPNVLFADTQTLALLDAVLFSLGGTKRRQPQQIMETPNQPVGASMSVLDLWTGFFPARPGHWGGWELTSYPQLTRIEFLDAAHLRAAASVTVGYSGATIVLEKRDGVWKAVTLTNQWVDIEGPAEAGRPSTTRMHAACPSRVRSGPARYLPNEACTCLACSRCATKAGRTLTSSAFSSAFCAPGISVLSSASITCWW